jgi:NADH-quinone oxidoreductase subunit H
MSTVDFWLTILTIVCVLVAILTLCAYLVFVERKISAWMQNRIGPNRVGPWGLLQPAADGLKFVFKEDVIPDHVDKLLYLLAPAAAAGAALLAFAVVPFGATSPGEHQYQFMIAPHVDIGLVFIFAVTSLTVYGVILGGWASNNKYSFLGALRASAQLVSYEIPMGTSIMGVVLLGGTLNLEEVIGHQAENGIWSWYVWRQPLGFLLFLTSVFAECNRLPFDLPEAEQELIGGYHTEYSALKFGLFFLGEYCHVITTSFLVVILFFGGWHFPFLAEPDATGVGASLLKLIVFFLKMSSFIVFYMLVRWTIPRFRFDQLMSLAWKVMIPLAFVNLLCVMVVKELGISEIVLLPLSLLVVAGSAVLAGYWPKGPERVIVVTRGHEQISTVAR